MKTPGSKFQTPKMLQTPGVEKPMAPCLEFEVWNFPGTWSLEFGISK
jgi:hypothetical protein